MKGRRDRSTPLLVTALLLSLAGTGCGAGGDVLDTAARDHDAPTGAVQEYMDKGEAAIDSMQFESAVEAYAKAIKLAPYSLVLLC